MPADQQRWHAKSAGGLRQFMPKTIADDSSCEEQIMATIVRGTFGYLQRVIAKRVADNHGEHLAAASALLMATIIGFQDEPNRTRLSSCRSRAAHH